MKLRHVGALLAAFLAAGAAAAQDLPVPDPVFGGAVGRTVAESTAEWPPAIAPRPGAPNIVLILLDDVGFGDVSTFGGAAQTPYLTRLAQSGLSYNNFHTTGLCTPTRAALLGGRNHHRMGFGNVGEHGYPGYHGIWKRSTASVARVLHDHGYSTAAFGKWHNTPTWEITPVGPFDRWPTGLGFDYFYGNLIGMSSQYEPTLWRNTVAVAPPATSAEGYHFTTDMVDDALGWIGTQRAIAPGKPYFVYFAPGAAHTPHHVPPQWIARYRGKFERGWDRLREEIFGRQKRLGVIPANARLTPRPAEIPAWESLSPDLRRVLARQMEVYAAFLEHTDHELGRLVDAIRAAPGGDNTLILYVVGDNGPEGVIGNDGADNLIATASGRANSLKHQLARIDELGGPLHTNIYSTGWAWAGATPFRWLKHVASHFGGVRNPLIVSWPAAIQPGGVRQQFTHVTDVVPTLYELAGIAPPRIVDGVSQLSLDGTSFAYSFAAPDAPSRHRVQYFETEGNLAIYQDGWVAAARRTAPWVERPWALPQNTPERWELYDVANDFSENEDLAARHPARLAKLRRLFDREARRNNVYPVAVGLGLTRPRATAGRSLFVYERGFPGVALSSGAAPDLTRSYRATARLWVPTGNVSGTIFAAGGRAGGAVLFAERGQLIFEFNAIDKERYRIVADRPLRPGEAEVAYQQSRDADGGATGKLFVNGVLVGTARFGLVTPPDSLDNFDIGQDSGEPVSAGNPAPARFTGTIGQVSFAMQ